MNTTSNPIPGVNDQWTYTFPTQPYQPVNWLGQQVEAICAAYTAKLITKAEARAALKVLTPFTHLR